MVEGLKNIGLRRLTTILIIIGIIAGLIAPALELFNIITKSNNIVIAVEILILTFLLVQMIFIKNSKEWKLSILIFLPVLLADIFSRIFSLYKIIPNFGYFGHFWTGIALATVLILVYNKKFKFILIFNFIIAILWEISEIIQDKIFISITPPHLLDTYADGFFDISLHIIGTLIAYIIFRNRKKFKRRLK